MRDVPGLDPIPLPWLHLTVQGVGFTDEIHTSDVQAVALPSVLPPSRSSLVPLFGLKPWRSGQPDRAAVRHPQAIRAGIVAIWGTDQLPEINNRFDPHLSIAYVNTDGPATDAVTALTSIQPEPARVMVTEATLIVFHREGHVYHWNAFARGQFADAQS